MNKYFKIKKMLMLSLMIVLVFFIFRDLKELIAFYKFDINASDLTADGRMLRNKFHASYYDPAILYSSLIKYILLILPMIISISLYFYSKIKNKCLKHLIGKNKDIGRVIFLLKIKLSILAVIYINIVIGGYTIVSFILTGFKIRQGANFNNIFLETNIFSFINGSFPKYLVLYIIGISTFIFFLTMLLLTITDYGYNYIHVILGYILLTYVVNDFFIMYISQNVSPLGSLFWLGGRARNITTFISYIYMILIYLSLRFTKRKEF